VNSLDAKVILKLQWWLRSGGRRRPQMGGFISSWRPVSNVQRFSHEWAIPRFHS